MADIKTNLRELSVVVGIYNTINNRIYPQTPEAFIAVCDEALGTDSRAFYRNISGLYSFDDELKQIIKNGFNLAEVIVDKFGIRELFELSWYGYIANKEEPYDISVNNIKFSLKEESFILENMGLYKLLNCFTGSRYRKRHVFEDYAPEKYAEWFDETWKQMLRIVSENNGIWCIENTQKRSKSCISLESGNVVFEYNDGVSAFKSILPYECNLKTFKAKTTARTRAKVFSKFINAELEENRSYMKVKKDCATAASSALARELKDNLNYSAGLPRFLRIHEEEYYYAKTTSSGVVIYKVPSLNTFTDNIVIESIEEYVPRTQANILTTIRNKNTKRTLVLRNECRFSHGQFNGTPEAKMYYESGGSLLAIYESI